MTSYELKVKSPTEIILDSEDGKIYEEFSLAKEPKSTSVLVQEARKGVLQTINLEELFKNLGVCAPLLNITYDAVNGTGYDIKDGKLQGTSLSAAITTLKDKFSKTVDTSLIVMTGFKTGTETAINGFLKAYEYLTDSDYVDEPNNGITMAQSKFKEIKNKAVNMHKDAASLAETFEEIETTAQNVTTIIMEKRDLDTAKETELRQTMSSLNAQVKAFEDVKADLDEEVKNCDEQYNKISKQIETNSKREFGLQLASTIISGATSLFNTVAGAFSTKAVVGGVINNAMAKGNNPEQQQQGSGNGTSTPAAGEKQPKNENLEQCNKTVAECTKRIAEIDARLDELKTLIEKADENERGKLLEEQNKLIKEKDNKNTELKAAESQAVIYQQQVSVQPSQIQPQQAEDKTGALYDVLDKITEQKAAVAKARRETMMKLAEMTSKVANATTEKRDLEVVLNALIMAISCMRIVKVYLSDIALFWKNVEKFCDRLIEGVESIQKDAASHQESKNYVKFFKKETFITTYLINIANWVALHVISAEYLDAFNKTRKEYQQIELNNKEGDPKIHWKRAQENAILLQKQFNIELTQGA